MACSHSTACPLFAQFQLNTTLRSWKIMYCDSDTRSRNCHRFKLSESGHAVPLNLLPNGTMLEIDAGAAAGQCGPATAPVMPAPAVRERVAAPALEPALAVAERVAPAPAAPAMAPAPGAPAVAARSAGTNAATPPQRVAPAAAPAQGEAPAALQRARSILDRILGRKG
jgi:hypothetical protein